MPKNKLVLNESQVAVTLAQAALLNAEIAAMQALNKYRENIGATIAYSEESFYQAMERYPALLGVKDQSI